ncbi:MAG: hypothetical protein WAT74_02080 [Flavobacteriales bacterium]
MQPDNPLASYRRQAIRYWEKGRLIYLGCLVLVVALVYVQTMPYGRFVAQGPLHVWSILFGWIACFIGANACYTAVYVLEFLFMGTMLQDFYLRSRWLALVGGIAFAMVLAYACAYALFWGMR